MGNTKEKDQPAESEEKDKDEASEFLEDSKKPAPKMRHNVSGISFKTFLANSKDVRKVSKYLPKGFRRHVELNKLQKVHQSEADWLKEWNKYIGG